MGSSITHYPVPQPVEGLPITNNQLPTIYETSVRTAL